MHFAQKAVQKRERHVVSVRIGQLIGDLADGGTGEENVACLIVAQDVVQHVRIPFGRDASSALPRRLALHEVLDMAPPLQSVEVAHQDVDVAPEIVAQRFFCAVASPPGGLLIGGLKLC